jgi:hypothetical protein
MGKLLYDPNDPQQAPQVPGAPAAPLPPSQQPTTTPTGRQPLREIPQDTAGIGADVAKSGLSGIAKGVVGIPGMPGDIQRMLEEAAIWVRNRTRGEASGQELRKSYEQDVHAPTSADAVRDAAATGLVPGVDYEPKTTAGKFAGTIGEFTGGAILPAGMAVKGLTKAEAIVAVGKELIAQGLAPGAASELAGQLAEKYFPEAEGAARAIAGGGTSMSVSGAMGPNQAGRTANIPGVGTVPTSSAAKVAGAIEDTGGAVPTYRQFQQVGPEATLTDLSDRLRGQGEALLTTPGPQQGVMREMLERRRSQLQGDNSSLSQALDQYVEPKAANYADDTDMVRQARRNEANRLYGEAEAAAAGKKIDTTPIVTAIEKRLPTSVAADATDLLPNERELLNIRGALTNRTDFQSLKTTKENLDDMIGEKIRAGGNPGPLIDVRNSLVDVLEDATRNQKGESAYHAANKAYRTDSQILEARHEGENLFKRSTRPDEFARQLRRMSDEEKTALRMGARDSIDQLMGGTEMPEAAMRNLRSNYGRQKMGLLLGDSEAEAFYKRIEGLSRQKGTLQRLDQQSATAGRLAGQKEVTNPVDVGAAVQPPFSSYPNLGQVGIGLLDRMYRGLAGSGAEAAAKAENLGMARLHNEVPADRMAFLKALDETYRKSKLKRIRPGTAGAYGAVQSYGGDE